MIEIMHDSSLTEAEVIDVDPLGVVDWRTSLIKHLENGELPEDWVEALRLKRRAAHYLLMDRVIYKRGYSLPFL